MVVRPIAARWRTARSQRRVRQLPEPTRRAILTMKQAHPDWGRDRIHDMLIRTEGLEASARAVQRVLLEAGYEVEEVPTRPHAAKATRFERTRPNELWQTDLFSFLLKRQRQRVHLVVYLDDFSRFVVGFGLHASASGALVREVLEQAVANFGAPEEVLTDNGAQYDTWRGRIPLPGCASGAASSRSWPARGGPRRWARSSASGLVQGDEAQTVVIRSGMSVEVQLR